MKIFLLNQTADKIKGIINVFYDPITSNPVPVRLIKVADHFLSLTNAIECSVCGAKPLRDVWLHEPKDNKTDVKRIKKLMRVKYVYFTYCENCEYDPLDFFL